MIDIVFLRLGCCSLYFPMSKLTVRGLKVSVSCCYSTGQKKPNRERCAERVLEAF